MARRYDRDRYLCALFAPAARRAALFALIAFNYQIARVRESVSEPMLGRIRLEWWREAIDGIYAGAPRRHEVVEPLAAAVSAFDLGRAHFERLIDAREADLDDTPPHDLAALQAYADSTSAPLVALMLQALGVRDGAAHDAGRRIGVAWALTGLLRALPHHAAQGRLYLPRDLMERAGLDRAGVLGGRAGPALGNVVAAVADEAQVQLSRASARRREIPRAARPALLPATLAGAYLARLRGAGYDPHHAGLVMSSFRRQLRLLATVALGRY